MMILCQCGCKTEIAPNRKWVSGHNSFLPRKIRIVGAKCSYCCAPIMMTAAAAQKRLARSKKDLFCNGQCRDQYRREHKGKEHPNYKRLRRRCSICRTTFYVIPSRLKKHQVYCSMECGREGRKRKIAGINFRKEPGTSPSSMSKRAKDRDGYRCKICGFREAIHSHHIVPKSENGKHELDNLITLCPNHHALVHAGLLTQATLIEALKEPIRQRELKLTPKNHRLYYRRPLR